ncbi:hypothetical protein GJ496_006493 [Pomphorhynchus laevis]|nr:hypothetical protein GJ496_006493 [Pomphorhynchus laevis]
MKRGRRIVHHSGDVTPICDQADATSEAYVGNDVTPICDQADATSEAYVGSDVTPICDQADATYHDNAGESARNTCVCEGNTQVDDAIPRNIDGSSTVSSLPRHGCAGSGQLPLCNVPTAGPSYIEIGPVNCADHNDAAVKMLQSNFRIIQRIPRAARPAFALLTFAKSVIRLLTDSSAKNTTRHCSLVSKIKEASVLHPNILLAPKSVLEGKKHNSTRRPGKSIETKMSQAAGEQDCYETSQTGDARDFITVVSRGSVSNAIRSFSNASAGGTDGLSPVHLKDLVTVSSSAAVPLLVNALCQFCRILLDGTVPFEFVLLSLAVDF